ncbi:MAG: class I tRNA ligase family protein, partial [Pseudonocardiaceae bacterium]
WEGEAYVGHGPAINSANDEVSLDGLEIGDAKRTIVEWLEAKGRGTGAVNFRLRDWLLSRQRYWGVPIPVVHCAVCGEVPVPEDQLPVELPELRGADLKPKGVSPLAAAEEWVNVECPQCGGPAKRDSDTMDTFVDSSWYMFRFVSPNDDTRAFDPELANAWMPCDIYVGGVEHAVLHLLYARFWQKVLFDLGHVSSEEPYRKLFNQGYIQAHAYRDDRGSVVPADEVEERDGKYFYEGQVVAQEFGKMGKSLKNMVTPDEIFERFGADTFRFYEMSMGPFADSRPWATKDVVGAQRFLQRLWRLVVDESTGAVRVSDAAPTDDDLRALHRTVAGVKDDYAGLRFNT